MVRVSETPYHFELKEIQFKLIFCFISINSALIYAGQSVTNVCNICACDQYQTKIDCYNRNLTSVPKAIPATVESLYLRGNKMTNIERDAFKDLINLKTLYLRINQITNIEKDAFKHLINLTYIDLRENKMTNIENDAFKDLIYLNYLDLSYNKMTNIERDAFKDLINLKTLDLSGNNITNIGEDTFKNLVNLKRLYLSHNGITNIPEGPFKNLVNLEELYLNDNQINKYEDGAFLFLPSLTHIELSGNDNMTCGCHLPAMVDYQKRTYNKQVTVLGNCRNKQKKLIPILEYSECKDYSLFQRKLHCKTCSRITCKDSEVTSCPGAEPVCMNRISMSGVTLKSDKSCSTYRECVAAKKNNTFPCNKLTSGTSCVTCCTGHLCNKNDSIDTVEAHCVITPNTQLKSATKVKGNIYIVQQTSEVRFYVTLSVFDADNPKEAFVLHIHEFNDTSKSCDSLGGHFNPHNHQHGVAEEPHVSRHAGGWGNFVANNYGTIISQFGDKHVSLRGPDSIIGRSIVLKSKSDNKGDSRERLACCVISKV